MSKDEFIAALDDAKAAVEELDEGTQARIEITFDSEEVIEAQEEINGLRRELEALAEGGKVNLTKRPVVSNANLKAAGWDVDNICAVACCITLSTTTGIPSGRCFPFALGM